MLDINNKEVKRVLDLFFNAGHKVTEVNPVAKTNIYLEKDFQDERAIVFGTPEDWQVKAEDCTHLQFAKVNNVLGLGIESTVHNRITEHFVIELESETKLAYIVVKVVNGIKNINDRKGKVANMEHSVMEVGFGRTDFVKKFGEYSTFNQKEWREFVKFSLHIENKL